MIMCLGVALLEEYLCGVLCITWGWIVSCFARSKMADPRSKRKREIQDGWSLRDLDCSSQWKLREREDATLSDEFLSLTDQQISSAGAPQVTSMTLVAGAAVLPTPWCGSSSCRVTGTSSLTDRCLELREGRAACCRLKKEARPEIPGQKSTISLIAAIVAGTVGCLNPSTGNQ